MVFNQYVYQQPTSQVPFDSTEGGNKLNCWTLGCRTLYYVSQLSQHQHDEIEHETATVQRCRLPPASSYRQLRVSYATPQCKDESILNLYMLTPLLLCTVRRSGIVQAAGPAALLHWLTDANTKESGLAAALLYLFMHCVPLKISVILHQLHPSRCVLAVLHLKRTA